LWGRKGTGALFLAGGKHFDVCTADVDHENFGDFAFGDFFISNPLNDWPGKMTEHEPRPVMSRNLISQSSLKQID